MASYWRQQTRVALCSWRLPVAEAGYFKAVLGELIEDPEAAIRMQRSQGLMKEEALMMHKTLQRTPRMHQSKKFRGLAPEDEAVAAVLLHHCERVEVREEGGSDGLVEQLLGRNRHAGGAKADGKV